MNKIKLIPTCVKLFFHLMRIMFQLINGIWKLSSLKNYPVTIFGGSRLLTDSIYVKKARELATKLKKKNIPVLTGGGLGVMEAANCAAYSKSTEKIVVSSVAVRVKGLDKDKKIKECSNVIITLDYFFARKWILTNYSIGFVIFPGGFGTLDEFMELVALIQTNVFPAHPIILIGQSYWNSFILWLNNVVLPMGLISEKDLELFIVTDDIDKAYEILSKNFEENFKVIK